LVSSRPREPIEKPLRHALTIRAIRDGPARTLILRGELDFCEASGLLRQAAITVDTQTERLVLDMAGVTFLDCAGARALAMAVSFAPVGCPVIIRSLNPKVRRVLDLLHLDLENPREPGPDWGPRNEPWGRAASREEPGPRGARRRVRTVLGRRQGIRLPWVGQDVQPLQQDGIDVQEVGREDAGGPGVQELPPGGA
jgi:anti-anti-sigma factor